MTDNSDPNDPSPPAPTDTDKVNAVLAVLQGKSLSEEANRRRVDLAEMTAWLNDFVTAGTTALRSRPAEATDRPSRLRVAVVVLLTLCVAAGTGAATADVFSHRRIYLGRYVLSIPKETEFGRKDNGSYELSSTRARANARQITMAPRTSAGAQMLQAVEKWFPKESRVCLVGTPASGRFKETKIDWAAQRYVQAYYRTGGRVTLKYVGFFLFLVERDGGALVLDVYDNKREPNHNSGWKAARDYLVQLASNLTPKISTSPVEKLDAPNTGAKCLGPAILDVPDGTTAKQGPNGGFEMTDQAGEAAANVAYRRMVSPEHSTPLNPMEVFDSIKKRWFSPTSCVQPRGERSAYAVHPSKDPDLTFPVGTRVQQRYEKQVEGKIATHGVLAVVSLKKASEPDRVDTDRHEDGDAIVIDVFAPGAATGSDAWKSVDNYLRSVEKHIVPDATLRPLAATKPADSLDGQRPCPWNPSHA